MSTTKETIGPRGTVPGFRPLIDSEVWHRSGFTPEMLEGGWRPLLLGEMPKKDDELLVEQWRKQTGNALKLKAESDQVHQRTCRPLPPPQVETFEAHGHVWYRHVPGDPCPVEPDVVVALKFREGGCNSGCLKASSWDWAGADSYTIIGYRFPNYPAVHTRLQKQQASAEPVEKTEQSFQLKLSDEEARDLAMVQFIRAHMNEEMETYTIWDAAWQAAKLHYTAKCSLPAASADSLPTPAA